MVSSSRKLVVLERVVLIYGWLSVLHKSHKFWNVHAFCEVFHIQAKVHHHLFSRLRIAITDQERTRDSTDNAKFKAHLLFNILISKELSFLYNTATLSQIFK